MVNLKDEINAFIKDYVKSYKSHAQVSSDWGEPVVAFADANDSLFLKLEEVVTPDHYLPSDLLADARTVISYFIPFGKEIVLSNAKGKCASKQWAKSYAETNQLIIDLNKALSELLEKKSFKAASTLPTHNFDKEKFVSRWSQKHVAYVAGLGKFGVHRMIITERGCCGRLGSLVTNAKIVPTVRVETEFCLYKIDGSCGICITKCSLKVLKPDALNKKACYEECLRNASKYAELGLTDVCGKCVVNVPCSFVNPSTTCLPLKY